MPEIFLLAVGSAFWPTLLAVDLIALRAPHPVRILASFFVASLLTTVTIGLVLIELLQDTLVSHSKSKGSLGPGVSLGLGVLALAGAAFLERRRRHRAPPGDESKPPGWLQRGLERGTAAAFVAGIVLNIAPGVLPFVALKDIAELDYGVAGTALVLLGFYVVMLAFIEVPLAAYVVAPESTAARTARVNAWLDRHALLVGIWALVLGGCYLMVRGILGLI